MGIVYNVFSFTYEGVLFGIFKVCDDILIIKIRAPYVNMLGFFRNTKMLTGILCTLRFPNNVLTVCTATKRASPVIVTFI